MGAAKGNNYNPKGRPKGTQNKIAKEIKEKITYFLEAKLPDMIKAFDQLTYEEQVRYYEKLLPYIIPKNAAIEFQIDSPEERHVPNWLKAGKPTPETIEVKAEVISEPQQLLTQKDKDNG